MSDTGKKSYGKRVRVLVPLTSAELGGGQLFLLKLIDSMPERFSFSVWLFSEGPLVDEFGKRGVDFRVLSGRMTRTPWGWLKLRRMLRHSGADLVYLHASRIISLLARGLGIPCVERINMSRTPEAGGWCNRWPLVDRIMSGWNSQLIAVSGSIKKQLLNRGVSESKVALIRNFVDVEKYRRPEFREDMRRELGVPEDALVVLNVGRMVNQKGQSDFLEVAARRIAGADGKKDFFVLVGDGPLRGELQAKADLLGLTVSGRFVMLPFRKDIERIYAACDVLLHTAHWDPLANVLLEAMAAGLFVIATDVDGSSEALVGYDAARIVRTGDVVGMSEALDGYDPDARKAVVDCWRKENVIAEYVRLFDSLVQ